MKRLLLSLLLLLFVGSGQGEECYRPAGTWYSATLSGYDEVPTISSAGRAQFVAYLSPDRKELYYRLLYYSLDGGKVTGAHLHLGRPGVAGGVIAPLVAKEWCKGADFGWHGELEAKSVVGPAAQGIAPRELEKLLRALDAGAVYVNLHTEKFQNGEIRGAVKAWK